MLSVFSSVWLPRVVCIYMQKSTVSGCPYSALAKYFYWNLRTMLVTLHSYHYQMLAGCGCDVITLVACMNLILMHHFELAYMQPRPIYIGMDESM
jgi:hypothetical protein